MLKRSPLVLLSILTGACGPKSPEAAEAGGSGGSAQTDASDTTADTPPDPGEVPTGPCGPGGTGDTGEASDSGASDDSGDSDPSGDPGPSDDTGTSIPGFACASARWVTLHGPGEFFHVLADSRGHSYACGVLGGPQPMFPGGVVTEFDPAGGLVRDTLVAPSFDTGSRSVFCDVVDAADRLPVLVSERHDIEAFTLYFLQTFAANGTLVSVYQLDNQPYPFFPGAFATSPDGAVVFTGVDLADTLIVQKRDSAGTLLWDRTDGDPRFQVHAINAVGDMVATRGWDQVVVLAGDDGAVRWERDWSLAGRVFADINTAGDVAIAGPTEEAELSVARFDATGKLLHDTRFNVHDSQDAITDLDLNEGGEIAVTGSLQNPDQQTFVVKLAADGDQAATHVCEGTTANGGYGVAIDDGGTIHVAGTVVPTPGPAQSFVASFD